MAIRNALSRSLEYSNLAHFSLTAAVSMLATSALANDAVYIADSLQQGDGNTQLYVAVLNPVGASAELLALPNGLVPLDQGDAIAVDVVNDRLYVIDKLDSASGTGTGDMGYYDLNSQTWVPVGTVQLGGAAVKNIVAADFTPGGDLIAHSTLIDPNNTALADEVYEIDPATGFATAVANPQDDAMPTPRLVNLSGAMAFDAAGDYYSYVEFTNANQTAPVGLYGFGQLPIVCPDAITGTLVGTPSPTQLGTGMDFLTSGDLLMLSRQADSLYQVNPASAAVSTVFALRKDGASYNLVAGDISIGPQVIDPLTLLNPTPVPVLPPLLAGALLMAFAGCGVFAARARIQA